MSGVHTASAAPRGLRSAGRDGARRARASAPRAGRPLGVAGLCLIGLALTWMVAALVPGGRFKDAVALHDFTLLSHTHASMLAEGVLALLHGPLYLVWALIVIGVALLRGRPRVALAAGLVMALTPVSAEALKPLLAHSHAHVDAVTVGPASWPSGHASAALALALCAVLVTPAARRPLVVVLGAAFALAVGCSLLILAWHMPSDVIGGYLLASLWMALAVAALRGADRRWPRGRRERRGVASGRGAALGSGLGVVGARLPQ